MLVNMSFWLAKTFYQKNDLLEKAATMKTFEYCPAGSEFKKQTDIAKKQYQRLDKVYEFDKKEDDKKLKLKKYSTSDLIFI